MNEPLKKAALVYHEHDLDFWKAFEWHLGYGFVFSTSEFFCMGFYSRSFAPDHFVDFNDANTAYITMWAGRPQPILCEHADKLKFVAYRRQFHDSFELRVYPMERLFQKLTKSRQWAAVLDLQK